MADNTCQPVSVSRKIDVPADKLFDFLARPANHPLIDGSGMLGKARMESFPVSATSSR